MWRRILAIELILIALAVMLGADYWTQVDIADPFVALVRNELVATFRSMETQWMAVACLTVYLFGFAYLTEKARPQGRRPIASALRLGFLVGFVGIALTAYALKYDQYRGGTHVPVLIGGMMLGQAAAFGQAWQQRRRRASSLAPMVLGALVGLLALAALWQAERARTHRYWTEVRWKGLWDNPNVYGMLMAVGLVGAVGLAIRSAQVAVQSRQTRNPVPPEPRPSGPPEQVDLECEKGNKLKIELQASRLGGGLLTGAGAVAAGLMGVGMVKSYSRGAWLAALVGLGYLGWHAYVRGMSSHHSADARGEFPSMPPGKRSLLLLPGATRRLWLPLVVVILALLVLAFWHWRHTERPVMRRVFSSFNPNDFSWRNRVTTWEGALQIIADHPWWGVGWEQPLRYYDAFYRPSRLPDGRALWSNDFLMLGMTLGLPALACFVGYVALSLTGTAHKPTAIPSPSGSRVEGRESAKPKSEDSPPVTGYLPFQTICRAGALALLVGFWFDGGFNGGLFTLATGATFWILLELGREG